jgi:Phage Mu protein F like protein
MTGIGFNTPFAQQLAFFKAKLALPTERWDDIERAAHDRSFIVAGAAKAELLQDIKDAVEAAIRGDMTYDQFHKSFMQTAQRYGWTGWTGEGSKAGQAWRSLLIYRTNLSTSYAAGRYAQLTAPDFLERYPYWVYHHLDGVTHPRPLHVSWDGLTLHYSHAFWKTHFPPNDWGCHCWVTATDEAGYQAALDKGKGEAPSGWDGIDPKTGAPVGIGKGWDYAPGANTSTPFYDLIAQKLIKLDAPIGAAMWQQLETVVQAELQSAFEAMFERVTLDNMAVGQVQVVGSLKPEWVARMQEHGQAPATAEIAVRDEDILHALRTSKSNKLDRSWYADLPAHLREPAAVLLDQTQPNVPALLLIYTQNNAQKLVVRINYKLKKGGGLVNLVRTGRTLDENGLYSIKQGLSSGEYILIDGSL